MVAKASSKLNMVPTCHISKDILKGLDDNDFIQRRYVHLTRVLNQWLQDDTNLGTGAGECFTNISETTEDIALPTMAGITHEQRIHVTLQQFYNESSDH